MDYFAHIPGAVLGCDLDVVDPCLDGTLCHASVAGARSPVAKLRDVYRCPPGPPPDSGVHHSVLQTSHPAKFQKRGFFVNCHYFLFQRIYVMYV